MSILARKLTSPYATITTKMEFVPEVHQHSAGLIIYYDNMNYINLRNITAKRWERGQFPLLLWKMERRQNLSIQEKQWMMYRSISDWKSEGNIHSFIGGMMGNIIKRSASQLIPQSFLMSIVNMESLPEQWSASPVRIVLNTSITPISISLNMWQRKTARWSRNTLIVLRYIIIAVIQNCNYMPCHTISHG